MYDRLILDLTDGIYVEINEGDGSNLLDEDIEAGYVDYFMCEGRYVGFDGYGDMALMEYDGAQVLLDKPYSEYSKDEIAEKALDMLGFDSVPYRFIEL